MAISDSYAYIACLSSIKIISIEEPENPQTVAQIEQLYCSNLTVAGDLIYVACRHRGLRIISIADPANPHEVGYCDTPDRAEDVDLSGDFAYLTGNGGISIISITEPENLSRLGSITGGGYRGWASPFPVTMPISLQ